MFDDTETQNVKAKGGRQGKRKPELTESVLMLKPLIINERGLAL